MSIGAILIILAAICFGVDAWRTRSLVSLGLCLLTIGAFIL